MTHGLCLPVCVCLCEVSVLCLPGVCLCGCVYACVSLILLTRE